MEKIELCREWLKMINCAYEKNEKRCNANEIYEKLSSKRWMTNN